MGTFADLLSKSIVAQPLEGTLIVESVLPVNF